MRTIPADLRLPLPKGWPNRIRSGVIHVISLAHFSLTFARSVAANSINARIRLKAENSRLRQKIAILRGRLGRAGLVGAATPHPANSTPAESSMIR